MADEIVPVDSVNPEEVKQTLEQGLEMEYEQALSKKKRKNLKKLVQLDFLEKERVARYICDAYKEAKPKHDEKCDDINDYDDVYRMKPISLPGDDGNSPTYRTPLTTTTLEVIHANIMNVFFTPAKIMRVIPTEEGDIPKISKLDIFGNWSVKNELEIFEKCDRLFHSSEKNGDCPYIVHWAKEYGEEIKREIIPNPMNPSEPLLDEDGEVMTQEREVIKLLYDGPKLEVFSRKDYILPLNAVADKIPEWEMRKIRLSADKVKRREDEGRYYEKTFEDIGGWGVSSGEVEDNKTDKDSGSVPMGKSEKLFLEFYGTLRIKQITKDDNDEESYEELEDEFIGIVELFSETLCSLKKNRFPLKERPIGLDIFIPDDEGRVDNIGVVEFMDGIQNCNDALYNQYVFGVTQSNSPVVFFAPTGNMRDEPIKIKAGYMYPTSDPKSLTTVQFPQPNSSLPDLMEQVRYYAQLLFGIGDYASGIASTIDPSAPAKKAEIVVAQGNVRLNLIIRRKNKTLKDIFRRWFLLYKENMPKNKFIRIAGSSGEKEWKFDSIKMSDFALNSIPDFELTGNVLNSNKVLDAQKKLGIYERMLANPFFSPQTQQGLQALHALTKWVLDSMDEVGLSNFLPAMKETIHTPEEENARFIQGDVPEPEVGQDHAYHLKTHAPMLFNTSLSPEILAEIKKHIQLTIQLLKSQVTMQLAAQMQNIRGGLPNGQPGQGQAGQGFAGGLAQPAGMGAVPAGAGQNQ
jgi:hypothetical protein